MTRFAYFAGHEQWHPEQLVAHAKLAEQAGFDMVVVSEHFHPWVDDHGAAGFAFSTIGAMAAATTGLEFATGVTTPLFRFHPGVMAQAAATSTASAGAFPSRGGDRREHQRGTARLPLPRLRRAGGADERSAGDHARLLDGEKLTYEGNYYRTDRAKLYSPPIGKVPIWMAAGGPKSAVLAAQKADGIITSVKAPADTIERVCDPARRAAKEAGRPAPPILATRWTIFASSPEEAWEHSYRGAAACPGTARGGGSSRSAEKGRRAAPATRSSTSTRSSRTRMRSSPPTARSSRTSAPTSSPSR